MPYDGTKVDVFSSGVIVFVMVTAMEIVCILPCCCEHGGHVNYKCCKPVGQQHRKLTLGYGMFHVHPWFL